tara:strand:- start:33 stop:362 length:330 start_codon:yes stop_codon:yes gene_type:complete
MKHIMVDIETLGTDSNSVIISISAVAFDIVTGKFGNVFEVGISILEQAIHGGVVDNDTITWWASQSKSAKKALTQIQTKDYKFDGIKHNGIDDCKHQIKYCSDAYRSLK